MKKNLLLLNFFLLTILLDAQDMAFKWAKQMGGVNYDVGLSIATDVAGNVYTAGVFRGTSDFDPGPGIQSITSSSSNNNNVFISKLNADGNFIWVKQIDLEGYYGVYLAVDAKGNICLAGTFNGAVDFDPNSGVYNLGAPGNQVNTDVFILELNPDGNMLWAKKSGGASADYCSGLSLDAMGNVHTLGIIAGPADFDPGPNTYTLAPNFL